MEYGKDYLVIPILGNGKSLKLMGTEFIIGSLETGTRVSGDNV